MDDLIKYVFLFVHHVGNSFAPVCACLFVYNTYCMQYKNCKPSNSCGCDKTLTTCIRCLAAG